MNNVKTTETNVFFFDEAIKQGLAVDQKGNKHKIICSTKDFIITTFDGVENCFNRDGNQFETFPNLKLKFPSRTKVTIFGYAIYNKNTMELISMENSSKAYRIADADENLYVVNTSTSRGKDLLKSWGIEKRYWYI
jgi:hypothetical protein